MRRVAVLSGAMVALLAVAAGAILAGARPAPVGLSASADAVVSETGAAVPVPRAADSDTFELWVTNQARNSVEIVRGDAVVDEINLNGIAQTPHILRFSPSGRYAFIASVGTAPSVGSANTTVIRTADRAVVATIVTGPGTHEASPLPDGSRVLVSVSGPKTIAEILVDEAAEQFTLGRVLNVGTHPLVVSAGLEGQPVCVHVYAPTRAYVGFHHGDAALLDTDALDIVHAYSKEEVGPNRCAFLPLADGRLMIGRGTETAGGYAVWDPATERFVTSTDTGRADTHGARVRPGSGEAWFVARGGDMLTVVSTAAPYHVVEVLPLGDAPDHLVFSPDGRWAYVTLRDRNR
jgi:DNA-binding beta-propeller fold protein YncE